MNIKSINTESDYQAALARLEIIFDAKLNTPTGDELVMLGMLIDNYEKTQFKIEP